MNKITSIRTSLPDQKTEVGYGNPTFDTLYAFGCLNLSESLTANGKQTIEGIVPAWNIVSVEISMSDSFTVYIQSKRSAPDSDYRYFRLTEK